MENSILGTDSFSRRLDELDLSLFAYIPSESFEGDRQSWLAVQRLVRRAGRYIYLEIGSHIGGSIQQHLVDPCCTRIISIDSRPPCQPDDRGQVFFYEGNSTARMLDNLRGVSPADLGKLTCYDCDATEINADALPGRPTFCFIDGEHTHAAVLSDFEFCLKVCASDAVICFHDDIVVWRTLRQVVSLLRRRGIPFAARKFTGREYGCTFGIFLRGSAVSGAADTYILDMSLEGLGWLRKRRWVSFIPRPLRSTARRVALQFGRQAPPRCV